MPWLSDWTRVQCLGAAPFSQITWSVSEHPVCLLSVSVAAWEVSVAENEHGDMELTF